MTEPLEPLDADVMAVLGQAKPMVEVPRDVRARVLAAVEARAMLGLPAGEAARREEGAGGGGTRRRAGPRGAELGPRGSGGIL